VFIVSENALTYISLARLHLSSPSAPDHVMVDYYFYEREQILGTHRARQTRNNLACGHNASTDCHTPPRVALTPGIVTTGRKGHDTLRASYTERRVPLRWRQHSGIVSPCEV
jgi:hypothetical protein